MGFFWFMFVCNLLLPTLMVGLGRLMWKHWPEKINCVYGYRTKRSMRNTETWQFANSYCGQLWWKAGWIMMPVSAVVQFPFLHGSEGTIGIAGTVIIIGQFAVMMGTVVWTERALRKRFP